ncbi:MAG: Glycerate kinase [Verrucomicrobiales bacterium]|nr:Glycerate kinase [Verrucomicrobiales bacterium]
MSLRVLVVPDKFKGTLDSLKVAQAIAAGWKKSRPKDKLQLLPMSDGGDGFGEVLSAILGAKPQITQTIDAAHQPISATWWWEPKSKTAIIESAKVVGLAMLPPKKFHPFQLDTFGLGKLIEAAAKKGAKKCLVGIGGSATNDGGFGMARALGWKFTTEFGEEILAWTDLLQLHGICLPEDGDQFPEVVVAVDVKNPLLGPKGCSNIYGPQKGLRSKDVQVADEKLKRLARVVGESLQLEFAKMPGAGAAGGLGFGLMTFLGARPESGFEIFAQHADLENRIRNADLVITGEGALDKQTLMGKGVGQVALLAKKLGVPCIGIAGVVTEPQKAKKLFGETRGLVEITTVEKAKKETARYLERLAEEIAGERDWK